MTKLDFKKTDKPYYAAGRKEWERLTVPEMSFLMIDGVGDPNGPAYGAALAALYPLAYGAKFALKARGRDFVVPPLEALWWAEDMRAFVSGDRATWQWTAMLRMPNDLSQTEFEAVRETVLTKQAKKKGGVAPELLNAVRLDRFDEGDCLQHLHLGSYADEAPVLADLHDNVMHAQGLTFAGHHHEIYLSDPRRVAPEKLRTILRQPVKPIEG